MWKGTSVWRLLKSFLPPLSSPPSISPLASKVEWQVSLLSFPSLLSCLRALWPSRGLAAQFLLLISLLCYCFYSFFPLPKCAAFSHSVSICKSWGWLKYLQGHGWFNLENICDSLTSNNSLGKIFLLSFLEFHSFPLSRLRTLYLWCHKKFFCMLFPLMFFLLCIVRLKSLHSFHCEIWPEIIIKKTCRIHVWVFCFLHFACKVGIWFLTVPIPSHLPDNKGSCNLCESGQKRPLYKA